GMTVPILLGEDFQLNYELGVKRNVELGTRVLFRTTPYEVEAMGSHRREKAKKRRRRLRNGAEGRTIRAAEDHLVRAHTCRNVKVEGDFRDDREWIIESRLLSNAEDSFFTIPNMLISARKRVMPISNVSERPRYIRKGEIVGQLVDPNLHFDRPKMLQEWEGLVEKTA
ncbi:hypothetical protein K438DRAFT_1456225, partial [Mycena galopus ATCC 62051]